MESTNEPQTAYDLLELVCEHIVEEPKRYHQGVWALLGIDSIANELGADAAPACGTVRCRAGWIVALHDGPGAAPLKNANDGVAWLDDVADRARNILDLSDDDTDALFDGSALAIEQGIDVDSDEFVDSDLPRRGTPEYAQLGAEGLRAFMAKHEAHLKARLLSDVPKLERK